MAHAHKTALGGHDGKPGHEPRHSGRSQDEGPEVLTTSGSSHVGDQLVLELEDRQLVLPWHGISPRALTKGYLLNVEKSRKMAEPARADEIDLDPAQFTMFLKGTPHGS